MSDIHRSNVTPAVVAIALLALSACSNSGPPPEFYVLGDAARPRPEAVSLLDDPVVEVKRVGIPDYLDTTDFLTHHPGGRLVASQSVRWGERLSIGVTRAIAASLEARLPQFAVTTAPPLEQPRWQVLIDIDAFEARPSGPSVLTARWSLREGRGGQRIREERVSLTAPVGSGTDAEVVAAMSRQLDQLAGRIAPALEAATPRVATAETR